MPDPNNTLTLPSPESPLLPSDTALLDHLNDKRDLNPFALGSRTWGNSLRQAIADDMRPPATPATVTDSTALPPRQINPTGLALIREFESFRASPYQDSNGVWTNGYGNTIGVLPNSPSVTMSTAELRLGMNVQWAERTICQSVDPYTLTRITSNQFSALVSFVFNVGAGRVSQPNRLGRDGFVWLANGEHSTMLKYLNKGQLTQAACEFAKWDRVDSGPSPGLLHRRMAEKALWDTPDSKQVQV